MYRLLGTSLIVGTSLKAALLHLHFCTMHFTNSSLVGSIGTSLVTPEFGLLSTPSSNLLALS